MEFLIGLLAVAISPKDRREWLRRYREPPTCPELELALEPFEVAMFLDGERARFFQDIEKLEHDVWRVQDLLIDSTAEHFVKPGRTTALSRAGAAIALLTLQTTAPEGGRGHVTSLRGGGPLSTLVVPGTTTGSPPSLWQRLWANMPEGLRIGGDLEQVFPWLVPTRRNDQNIKTTPADVHPAQAFFGLPRRIRLIFERNENGLECDLIGLDDEYIVKCFAARPGGTKYEAWGRVHPLTPYRKSKKGAVKFLPVHIYSSRIGFQDWLGLVTSDGDETLVPAQSVDAFWRRAADLERRERSDSRLLASAYVMRKNSPLEFAEALLPLIIGADEKANDAIRALARKCVTGASLVALQLQSAVLRALYGSKGKAGRDGTVLDGVRSRFWADTDDAFYASLRNAARSIEDMAHALSEHRDDLFRTACATWLGVLKHHALGIFDDAVPIESADSDRIGDIVEGRKLLALALSGHGPVGKKLFQELGQPPVGKA
jgi:CRISPR system Cascade subunit CasA